MRSTPGVCGLVLRLRALGVGDALGAEPLLAVALLLGPVRCRRADCRCRYVGACVGAAIGVRFGVAGSARWCLVEPAQKSWKKFLHLYIECVYNN